MWLLPIRGNENLALYVIQRMRAWDRREIFACRRTDDEGELLADVMATGEMSWIAGRDEEPIAVFGCHALWPGVWSMWFFATDNLRKIGKSVTRFVRNVILPGLFRDGAHRLECRSMAGHAEAQRWLTALGAVSEGVNRALGRGREDFHVFVWKAT